MFIALSSSLSFKITPEIHMCYFPIYFAKTTGQIFVKCLRQFKEHVD